MRRRILTLTVGLTTVVILAFAVPLAFLIYLIRRECRPRPGALPEQAVASLVAGGPPVHVIRDRLTHETSEQQGSTWVRAPDGTILGNRPAGVAVGTISEP